MSAKPNLEGEEEEFNRYLTRLGSTSKDRLRWALRMVNAYRHDRGGQWSPGDWLNTRLEIAVFAGIGKSLPGHGGVERKSGKIIHPSQNEAQGILDRFQQMLEDAAQHKPIRLGPFRISQEITWVTDCYRASEAVEGATWADRACYYLGQLLKEEGHRVSRCRAMLAHSGKKCLAFFLKAKRGKFCSRECASREMTRAKRERDKKGGFRHGKKAK